MTLSVKDLSFQIGGKKLIDSVSFDINKGEIVLLCGMSGSGKSTLANLINGYFPENGGKQKVDYITIDGEEVQEKGVVERSEYVRSLFQNARLSFSMKTLREEMVFCLENNRTAPEEMTAAIEQKAEEMKLTYLLDQSFDDLSGGELQRAAFLCADLVDVPLYIMDEPFANVDVETMQDYIDYMKQLVAKGKSILIIDHHVRRWDWVDRWFLLDSKQTLHDLSLLNSAKEKQDRLISEGVLLAQGKLPDKKTAPAETVLELDEVSVYYDKVIRKSLFRKERQRNMLIEEAQLSLPKGSLTALTGPSGIGKSSLFKAILNVSPFSGEIRLEGESNRKMKAGSLYAKVGLVFQDPSLQFVKTKVIDEMTLSLTAWNTVSEEQAESRARELLSQHHFINKESQSPWVLSQGQQRRLAVICMTVGNQSLLLVDEPTYGQDARNAQKIMDKLKELCEEGMTCLFTSHDTDLVDAYADSIYAIKDKKVTQVR